MFYITGDTHGDFSRLSRDNFPEQKTLTKEDYVVICGDFGIWDDSKEERYWLDWLDQKPFTTLFVTGNHSNYDLLATFPTSEWRGGQVQFIRPSVIHLLRGQIFTIDNKRIFTMGGATSHDISDGILDPKAADFCRRKRQLDARGALYRINHRTWWKEELPNEAEYETARRNLAAAHWQVDYILTHCCPSGIVDILGNGAYGYDALTDFLEEIRKCCQFQYWFFGHYHQNRVIERRFVLLYEQIIELNPHTKE